MYFWKIEDLKKDIEEGRLTEKDRFIYLFISIIMSSIMLELTSWATLASWATEATYTYGMSNYIDSLLSILIPSFGVFLAFKANGGLNGADFLGKYLSISFVVGVRFILIGIIPIIVVLILYGYFFGREDIDILSIILIYPWYIVMYKTIISHIRNIKYSQ